MSIRIIRIKLSTFQLQVRLASDQAIEDGERIFNIDEMIDSEYWNSH